MPYLKLGPGPEGIVKVACAPCIRGHRASSCDHFTALLIEVKRPGRPQASHVSLPLKQHPCKDGEARTWLVHEKKGHESETFKANAKNHTFQPDEISPAGAAPYPKPKGKKGQTRRKALNGLSDEIHHDTTAETTRNGGFGVFKTHVKPKAEPGTLTTLSNDVQDPTSAMAQMSLPPFSPNSTTPTPKLESVSSCCSTRPAGSLSPVTEISESSSMTYQQFSNPQVPSSFHQHVHQAGSRSSTSRSTSGTFADGYNVSTPATPNLGGYQGWTFMSPIKPPPSDDSLPVEFLQASVQCICGTACNCLGCPQHPHNPRTSQHVNEMHDFMATDSFYNPDDFMEARRQAWSRILHSNPKLEGTFNLETDWEKISIMLRSSVQSTTNGADSHPWTYSAVFHDETGFQLDEQTETLLGSPYNLVDTQMDVHDIATFTDAESSTWHSADQGSATTPIATCRLSSLALPGTDQEIDMDIPFNDVKNTPSSSSLQHSRSCCG